MNPPGRPTRRQSTASRGQLPIYPSPAEVDAMMRVATNDRDRLLVRLLFITGARITEALRLRAGDFTRNGVRLLNEKQGSPDAQKHVYIPALELAELKASVAHLRPADYVFRRTVGDDGSHITRGRAWGIITGLARKADVLKLKHGILRPVWCHAIRHATAIHLLDQGLPVNAVQPQLGHADLRSTATYLALADPHREKLMASVSFGG